MLQGGIAYSVGNTIATLILGGFSIYRMIGIMFAGGILYAIEIPNYFRWIDDRIMNDASLIASLKKTILVIFYFNPIWITRHLFFINFFSWNWHQINLELIIMGTLSFIASLPISLAVNYINKNKLPYHWRFFQVAFMLGC
uniref:Uncharacterized protein n=1 Tax=Candidatus Kentrum sp. LPFa TaxID=2126335 RepID=A0A450WPV4_9GAMM|nr:MAG: hypothetical protein BECKLPF1236A_GA0070988_102144 [Candidatus Kentron sp. LPFa]VFK35045.1 MAG: hypothetical protein BECKLPF1236C_GA0070990_103265 [Candidatus Kentron sp. LPFa]